MVWVSFFLGREELNLKSQACVSSLPRISARDLCSGNHSLSDKRVRIVWVTCNKNVAGRGQQDGSVAQGACCQVQHPEFDLWDPLGMERSIFPAGVL